jgi:hypothetical protein
MSLHSDVSACAGVPSAIDSNLYSGALVKVRERPTKGVTRRGFPRSSMSRVRFALAALVFCLVAGAVGASARSTQPAPQSRELVPIQWLEPASSAPARDLPALKARQSSDPRLSQAARLIDNEAARFVRTVIAAAWRLDPSTRFGGLLGGALAHPPVMPDSLGEYKSNLLRPGNQFRPSLKADG